MHNNELVAPCKVINSLEGAVNIGWGAEALVRSLLIKAMCQQCSASDQYFPKQSAW